jgi:hypothetical protein
MTKPSLANIESNIFQAIERDISFKSVFKNEIIESSGPSRRKTNNFAVKVERSGDGDHGYKPTIKCTLCSDDHPYYKCLKYRTPVEKIKRLEDLGGCTRCGYTNHISGSCKLNNLKCELCGGAHFPCLCMKSKFEKMNAKSGAISKNKSVINNSIVWTSYADNVSEGSALPTFTTSINNKIARVMKDSGAQATLITESFANACKLNIIEDNISITINGFNGPKQYISKLVEVPVVLNDTVVLLKALCVPIIDICLRVPGLGSVVEKLKHKNYELADRLFDISDNKIGNIDMVLGADFSYCVPITTKVFGKHRGSTLLLTPIGVMLEGSMCKLLDDIDFLDDTNLCVNSYNVSANERKFFLCDEDGKVSSSNIRNATEDMLESECCLYLNNDETADETSVEINDKLSDYVLSNITCENNGRLIMPLMWNGDVQHLLGHNYNLAKQILKSNFNKLSKDPAKLLLTDEVFKEQERLEIIERIDDFETFKVENPNYSFLPHMSVFRMNKETTKCRVVYLSNITENNPQFPTTVSPNQAIMSGPNLNQKLSTSLLLLKFDEYLIIFDIVKAFLMIAMKVLDQARLLIMWYANVKKGDFNVVYYKAKRLPFGISCAPALLMLAIYKILIIDDDKTDVKLTKLRNLVYTLFYVDNGGFSSSKVSDLYWAKENLINIFGNYQFNLQQFVCNVSSMQEEMDLESGVETPEVVNLYGLKWNRVNDLMTP